MATRSSFSNWIRVIELESEFDWSAFRELSEFELYIVGDLWIIFNKYTGRNLCIFYNIENLFDLRDSRFTNDGDFLPESVKRWTPKRYKNKLRKLSYAIANIGLEDIGKTPALMGFAEVENKQVIEDLLNTKHLKELPYDYVHYDSPDERGIDVALLYNK